MFRKTIITGVTAISMLGIGGGIALADAPTLDGNYVLNEHTNVDSVDEGGNNDIAWGSSAIIQNGQFISGRSEGTGWQNQAGERAAQVQADLARTGLGSQG